VTHVQHERLDTPHGESIARSFVGVDHRVDIAGRWPVTRHHGSSRCSRGLSGDKRRWVVEGGAPPGLGVAAASEVGTSLSVTRVLSPSLNSRAEGKAHGSSRVAQFMTTWR